MQFANKNLTTNILKEILSGHNTVLSLCQRTCGSNGSNDRLVTSKHSALKAEGGAALHSFLALG